MENKKFLYNTVLSQVISNCGDYLFVGNNFGEIFVYSISQIYEGPDHKSLDSTTKWTSAKPLQIYLASEKSPIFSLAFYKDFLIIGTSSEIIGCAWVKNCLTKKSWEIQLTTQNKEIIEQAAEVNCIWLDKQQNGNTHLYAGCGDNTIYEINLENGKIIRTFDGHKDYVHSIHGSDSRLFSASEDGTIRFWDIREKQLTGILEPYKNEKLQRPEFGKWQGTVSVTDDWLVCGGGPKFSLWHLRSLECTTVFPFHEKIHVSGFLDDIIYAGGEHNEFYQYSFNGDIVAKVPISSSSIYSIIWQNEPIKIMSIGGSSNNLDICTDFKFRDMVLNLHTNNMKNKV